MPVGPRARRASSSIAFANTGSLPVSNTPTRCTDGSISRSSSMFFAFDAADISDTPVMFPPGRAKLGTMPVSTGSAAMTTIGISRVASFAAGDVERHNHIDLEPDKLGRELRKSIQLSFRGAKLEYNIFILHIAKLTQSFSKLLLERLRVCESYVECAYSGHLGLLPVRRKRPRDRRAAEKGDELAPLHVRPQGHETASYRLKRVL